MWHEAFRPAGRTCSNRPRLFERENWNLSQRFGRASIYGLHRGQHRWRATRCFGLQRYFTGHRVPLFLLGTLRGIAFYRVQPTATYTCWAEGSASHLGSVERVGCPNVIGPYPLRSDDSSFDGTRTHEHFTRIAGIAADGAVRMAIEDGVGQQLATTPVVRNLFVFQQPLPALGRIVAINAHGQVLRPHPGWGHHQTRPF